MIKEAKFKQEAWGTKDRRGRVVPKEAVISKGRKIVRIIRLNVAADFKK